MSRIEGKQNENVDSQLVRIENPFFERFQEEKKRKENEQRAKEVYNHWLEEKEKERKRLIEVKRMEQEEREVKAKGEMHRPF